MAVSKQSNAFGNLTLVKHFVPLQFANRFVTVFLQFLRVAQGKKLVLNNVNKISFITLIEWRRKQRVE